MKIFKLYAIICVLAALVSGCQKQGYLPPAEGEKIAYADTTRLTLKEAIAHSPATLFNAAWQRSNMDSVLKALTNGKTYFTVLVPSNAALEKGGYNLQKIQSMDKKVLDTMLMFYTLRNNITEEDLSGRSDDYAAKSILTESKLKNIADGSDYYYRHHLKLQDGKMIVNGKIAGSGKSIGTKGGNIWFLDMTIAKPTKSLLKVLEDDGRFSLLLEILRYTDAQWNQIILNATGFPGTRESFSRRLAWEPISYTDNVVYTNTVFIPTNAAFKAAGFNNLQDLIDFNRRKGLPYYGLNPDGFGYAIQGNFATDSLLDYSLQMGKMLNVPLDQSTTRFPRNIPIFYSNLMENGIVRNYLIDDYTAYYMPLDFSKDNSGSIYVKAKDAEAAPAKVVEADIPTLMGPLNVIDHIIIPKGYKIN